METTVNERIKTWIDVVHAGNVAAAARAAGLNRSTINSVIGKGRVSTVLPGYDVLKKIGETSPRISLDWLILGEGDMLRPGTSTPGAVVGSSGNINTNGPANFNSGEALAALTEQLRTKDGQIAALLEILKTR